MKALGFKSGNDVYILKVLRYIRFIDSSGAPTEFWKEYKDPTQARVVLAKAITQGYKELFSTYADAYKKDRKTLYAFSARRQEKQNELLS